MRHRSVLGRTVLGSLFLALSVLGCPGGSAGDGEEPPRIPEALTRCTGLGGAWMWSLIETLDPVLKHVDYGALPSGVVELSRLEYEFDVVVGGAKVSRAHVLLSSSYDISSGFPVGAAIVMHWVLDGGDGGEGRFSAVRLDHDTLNFIPVGLPPANTDPRIEPEPGCVAHVEILNIFVPFVSSREQVLPVGSNFMLEAVVGGGFSLVSSGNVGYACVASMSGTYQGEPFTYTVDLRTGAVTY